MTWSDAGNAGQRPSSLLTSTAIAVSV